MDNVKDLLAKIESGELSYEEKLASLAMVEDSLVQMRQKAKEQAIGNSVEYILESFNIIKAKMEKRLAEMVPEKGDKGDKGQDGKNGRDGKDGRPGRDGGQGPKGTDGLPGRDGRDGTDGVSVTDANIDFDGSLIITLSSGRVINVGEVVAPDLAEKIKVITNGGGTSQSVLDTLASLQTQIDTLIPSQTGNAGKYLTTNGTATSWATVSGSGDVVGPASATNNNIALFDGTTGKLIKQSSALTFDGTNLGIANGSVTAGNSGVVLTGRFSSAFPTPGAGYFQLQTNNVDAENGGLSVFTLSGGALRLSYRILDESVAGGCSQAWSVAGSEQMRLTSTGLGIGTSSPAFKADIVGQTRSTAYIETKTVISASAIDLTAGNYFTKTISGATTFTTSGTPATGNVASLVLDLTNGGSAAVTWWSGVKWASGTAPTLTASGRDVLGFFTHDGGTTWNGFVLGKAMA
jgi:hypothetical protein